MAYYVPPPEKVGGTRPRVPHQIAPMLDRMLSRHPKTQHAQMNHGLQSMRQFASTKMNIDQYYDQP